MNLNFQKQFTSEIVSKAKSKEKGFALILSLGLFVILVFLGLAFVTLIQIDREKAASKLDVVTAKLSTQSVLERVIRSIQYNNNGLNEGKIYPGTSSLFHEVFNNQRVFFTHDATGDPDLINKFKTSFKNSLGSSLDYISQNYLEDGGDKINWEYLKIDEDGDGNKDRTLGRIAYLIIDESGKIDPNQVTAPGVNEELPESRKGVDVDEINIQGAGITSSYNDSDGNVIYHATDLGYDNAGGKRPSNAKWFSWAHIIGEMNFDQAELDTCTASLFPFSHETPEAFWIDGNGDNMFESSEYFHRFNLSRTDWDDLVQSDITAAPTEWSETDVTHEGTGIPWLANWTGSEKKQIIANLLDYCDTDSIPKTDSDGSTAPTYLGLEKTAYINEINLTFSQTPVVKASAGGTATYTWNAVSITIDPEIVNVYSDQVPVCTLTLNYEITGTINKGHAVSAPLKSLDGTDGLSGTLTFNYGTTNGRSFQTGVINTILSLPDSYATPDEGLPVNLTINDIKLTALLKDSNGNLIDYSVIATDANAVDLDLHPSIKYADYQTNDPRYNQFIGQWTAGTGDTDNSTLGATNSTCNPSAGGDQESGTQPWVSTCYIRNAPMQSLWELGCIHRGAAWETINLKAYNKDDNGGDTYAKGDANILDQVKITSDTMAPAGRVNINSSSTGALKALVTNIYAGENYENPEENSGILIDPTNADKIAEAIQKINGSTGGTAFVSRAGVADACSLYNIVDLNTDAKKEAVIGKFINLTQVRHNYFTVLIVAQSINLVEKPTAEQKILAVIYRDAYTNECKVLHREVLWERTF